ncbi:MAG: HAD family hydrolase [Synechococcales cyanobacterium C42_A2020_086]|jgi:phosphoglycolate phosphatase-like HAD superfamily hydrolase|nr:HAD family hydrolase [Synechococcales cyanobacterium C42_A2020_086]
MLITPPTLLAFDFDGVLCDGLLEYFQTAWRAYCRIWTQDTQPPEGLDRQFYRLRPVVESGWEMPVLLRAVLLGIPETEIFASWSTLAPQVAQTTQLSAADIAGIVDGIRDEWISRDLQGWLALHRFYPGVVERLQQLLNSSVDVVIITTKEGRFVQQLLQQQGLVFSGSRIYGKEVRQPKAQTLRDLLQYLQELGKPSTIWFIEDRLKTLQGIKAQPDLSEVILYLADWGYNTAADRELAAQDASIHLLSLAQFAQAFPHWLESPRELSLDQ